MQAKGLGYIGFDIGGTNIRVGLGLDNGRIVGFFKEKTEANKGIAEVINKIVLLVRKITDQYSDVKIEGVGIGIAGILKPSQGIVCFSPNLPGWRNIPLVKILQKRVQLPVFIENDANLIALGEAWQGAGKDEENFVLLTLGTGVGGGIIANGKLWTGETSGAEFGHMKINPQGERCLCGRRGCLETYASATWLVKRAQKGLKAGMPSILNRYQSLTAKDIFTAAQRGDILARHLFQLAGWALGIGIANLCNILGFTTAIIGGGVSHAWEAFIGSLKYTLAHELLAVDYEEVKILKSKLNDMAGIYGACYLVKQEMKNK